MFAPVVFLALQIAISAPVDAAPAPAMTASPEDGVAIFHDMPFKHPVTLVLRAVDPATGAFGDANILVNATDFAAGSGRLHAPETVKQFHAAVLKPGAYAVIGKYERMARDGGALIASTCRPNDAEIFELSPGGRVLVAAPVGMTADPADMESQLQLFLKGDDAQLKKDLAAILGANPSFAGDYRPNASTKTVRFKMTKGIDECLKPGAAKGKIVAKPAPKSE